MGGGTLTEVKNWEESWLSGPRFVTYLNETRHDREKAIALYEWNAMVSSALHHDLAHLEIGLRNAYNRALCRAVSDSEPHWVFEPNRFFRLSVRKRLTGFVTTPTRNPGG
jgi:hypothetical protein